MRIVSDEISNHSICTMPSDERVKVRLDMGKEKLHHVSGKKTKGHGGS